MYIEPNTTIKLLGDVPLDEAQTDTLWFASPEEQISYMNSKVVVSLGAQSFQRASVGRCRLQVPIATAYKCNYMMFQNSSFFGKWFFAFVTNVEYVNNVTTEISFVIDEMQTWLFEYKLEETFVERETVGVDTIGAHIEPENMSLGEYVLNGEYKKVFSTAPSTYKILAMFVHTPDIENGFATYIYDNVPSSLAIRVFDMPVANGIYPTVPDYDLASFIKGFNGMNKLDNIVGIYPCPSFAVGVTVPRTDPTLAHPEVYTGDYVAPRNLPEVIEYSERGIEAGIDRIDTYLPKNNKLYTYPYNYFHVDSPTGQTMALRYEFFNNLTPSLKISGTVTMPVEISCYPTKYKGVIDSPTSIHGNEEFRTERLTFKGMPMCPFAASTYEAWVAQNGVPQLLNFATTVGSGIIGAQMGAGLTKSSGSNVTSTQYRSPSTGRLRTYSKVTETSERMYDSSNNVRANTGSGILSDITGSLSSAYSAAHSADISRGSIQTGSNDYCAGRMTFFTNRMSINRVYAKRIDEYFTMFGYAVGIVKEVKTRLRERFTYVKTVGANVHGSMPADSAHAIANMFDNGIRFWADHTNVNNYELDNSPLGEE